MKEKFYAKMADGVVVWFTWSRFSKSKGRIKAKKHLVRNVFFFKYLFFLLELFRSVNPSANFCIFNFVSESVVCV